MLYIIIFICSLINGLRPNVQNCIHEIYIENEYHFVLECKQSDSLRKKYIPDILFIVHRHNYSKLLSFYKTETQILKNLALYISEA